MGINEILTKKICDDIFELSKMFPDQIDTLNLKVPISRKEITYNYEPFKLQFEDTYSIDDFTVLEKIKELARKREQNHVWIFSNPFVLSYELFSSRY